MTIATKAAHLFPCAFLIAGSLLTGGCASTPQTNELLATRGGPKHSVELTDVPFFPQMAYQCGPAALATVLGSAEDNSFVRQVRQETTEFAERAEQLK